MPRDTGVEHHSLSTASSVVTMPRHCDAIPGDISIQTSEGWVGIVEDAQPSDHGFRSNGAGRVMLTTNFSWRVLRDLLKSGAWYGY